MTTKTEWSAPKLLGNAEALGLLMDHADYIPDSEGIPGFLGRLMNSEVMIADGAWLAVFRVIPGASAQAEIGGDPEALDEGFLEAIDGMLEKWGLSAMEFCIPSHNGLMVTALEELGVKPTGYRPAYDLYSGVPQGHTILTRFREGTE